MKNLLIFIHSCARLHCHNFLVSVIGHSLIFSIWDNILDFLEKVKFSFNFVNLVEMCTDTGSKSAGPGCRSGSAKMIPIPIRVDFNPLDGTYLFHFIFIIIILE